MVVPVLTNIVTVQPRCAGDLEGAPSWTEVPLGALSALQGGGWLSRLGPTCAVPARVTLISRHSQALGGTVEPVEYTYS